MIWRCKPEYSYRVEVHELTRDDTLSLSHSDLSLPFISLLLFSNLQINNSKHGLDQVYQSPELLPLNQSKSTHTQVLLQRSIPSVSDVQTKLLLRPHDGRFLAPGRPGSSLTRRHSGPSQLFNTPQSQVGER